MIKDVLGTLVPEVEAVKSPMTEEEEEVSSSIPGKEANERDDVDTEEQMRDHQEASRRTK